MNDLAQTLRITRPLTPPVLPLGAVLIEGQDPRDARSWEPITTSDERQES